MPPRSSRNDFQKPEGALQPDRSSRSETLQSHEDARAAVAAAGLYRLLARLWLREVDLPLLRELATPPLRDLFTAAGGVLPESIDQAAVDRLARDYCRLLIGPAGHLPPYQSVWQDGQFQGRTTASMQTFAALTHHRPPPGSSAVMRDHLGLQLDLAARICDQFPVTGAAQLAALHDLRQSYFAAHLTWPDPFFEAALQQSGHGFYRALITLTRDFLHSESASL